MAPHPKDDTEVAVSKARARELALSFPDAAEAPHFDRVAFRTPRRIFATLGADRYLNLMFDPDLRDFFCEQAPAVFSPVPGGWGRNGATRCDLDQADEPMLGSALDAAHLLAGPKPRRRQPR